VILAGGLLTIAFSLYLVRTTYSSLPYWDGWRQIEVAANGASPVSPSWLWQQHNEHRLVLPKLFLAVDLQLFGARQAFMLASIFAIQLMHFGPVELEHAGAGQLERRFVAHRHGPCGVLPFLPDTMGKLRVGLSGEFHFAFVFRHRLICVAGAVFS
jgi:hypothetical protein